MDHLLGTVPYIISAKKKGEGWLRAAQAAEEANILARRFRIEVQPITSADVAKHRRKLRAHLRRSGVIFDDGYNCFSGWTGSNPMVRLDFRPENVVVLGDIVDIFY